MELITVRELFKNTQKYAGQEITVGGWVRNKRPSKQFGFIVLNDGSYFTPVQVVYNDSLENFQEISKINISAALIVRGTLELTPDAKQPFEIQASSITVEGPCALHGATYTVLPDRIETATFLCACAACSGTVTLRRAAPQTLAPVLDALRASGCTVTCGNDTVTLVRTGRLMAGRPVTSAPYPAFPTDAMPVLMAALLRAEGETSFTETIFERRFGYVSELQRLGADLVLRGNTVFLTGARTLRGAPLCARDLRGGAALVIAAMCAEGESPIYGVKHIERGYDNLAADLAALGGAVKFRADAKTVEIPTTV